MITFFKQDYKAPKPLDNPPRILGWTQEDWDTLSPGFKREIVRDLKKRDLLIDE